MMVLDTCILIFDALTPEKLSTTAKQSILDADEKGKLACSDISLWEIAMLIRKKRIVPGIETSQFLKLVLEARAIRVLPITVEIAIISGAFFESNHYDPADRLIAATAIYHQASLITSDSKLRKIKELNSVW